MPRANLLKLLKHKDIDIVAIQEIHCDSAEQLQKRGEIPGYELLGATYHKHYGVATYAKRNIENASLISSSTDDDIS